MEKLQIDIGVQSGKGDYGEQGNLKIGYVLTDFYLRQECFGKISPKEHLHRTVKKYPGRKKLLWEDGILDKMGARDKIGHTLEASQNWGESLKNESWKGGGASQTALAAKLSEL